MVIQLLLWLCIISPISIHSAADPSIRVFADLDPDPIENSSIMGTVSVEHPYTLKIDEKSFELENSTLKVEKLKDVRYSPNDPLTLSLYRFQLPPMKKGLYPLEKISVKVGGKIYSTTPSTFEVKRKKASLDASSANPKRKKGAASKPVLILEAFVEPNQNLYPGQKAKVGYRYYFNHSIEASKEVLPLLEAKGFKKVGGKIARSAQGEELSLLEIAQEIEAIAPGVYRFGPSEYEGNLVDTNGDTLLPTIMAKAPETIITVIALPTASTTPSYKNAIGKYTFETELKTPSRVEIGEKMSLLVRISGTPIEGVELPDLCCQPGMAGRFHFSDLPPAGIYKGDSEEFSVEIRPIDSSIKEIPSLKFTYFDPNQGNFVDTYSKPIAIKVMELPQAKSTKKTSDVWPKMNLNPSTTEIADLKPLSIPNPIFHFLSSWWGLLTLPIGAGILLFQIRLRKALEEYRIRIQNKNSLQLLKSLPECDQNDFLEGIRRCMLLKLVELGVLSEIQPYETLHEEGSQGKVKHFLLAVDRSYYTQEKQQKEILIQDAVKLYGSCLKVNEQLDLNPLKKFPQPIKKGWKALPLPEKKFTLTKP